MVAEALSSATQRLQGAGIEDARLEAEVLLAHALGSDRTHLLAELRSPLAHPASEAFERELSRRLQREPLAYITGHREFYGIDFICAPGALIPRPESELLVEFALRRIAECAGPSRVVDVGTGTGAIAIAIAIHAPTAQVVAIERSPDARTIAARNLQRHQLEDRVELQAGDLLEGAGVFDIIVANLPYVAAETWRALPPEIRDHEPREALVAGPLGTEAIEALLHAAPPHLAVDGLLAVEMGDTQARYLAAGARVIFPKASVCVMKDLAGRDRLLEVRRGGGG